MSYNLDNLGWFYRGKMGPYATLSGSLDNKFSHYALLTCTVAGFFTIFAGLVQFARLMLSLFILPGKSV